jgi:hypothetical protein
LLGYGGLDGGNLFKLLIDIPGDKIGIIHNLALTVGERKVAEVQDHDDDADRNDRGQQDTARNKNRYRPKSFGGRHDLSSSPT